MTKLDFEQRQELSRILALATDEDALAEAISELIAKVSTEAIPHKEKRVINGNLTHVWQDIETGMWIAEFLRMLESAETPELAIERLQSCVLNQAKMFAGESGGSTEAIERAARRIAQALTTSERTTEKWAEWAKNILVEELGSAGQTEKGKVT